MILPYTRPGREVRIHHDNGDDDIPKIERGILDADVKCKSLSKATAPEKGKFCDFQH